eukprot:GILJ01009263.1.p1 GENE.GILJ01009263.1~~GILJ01009263.1.p1  ORF type:complete len:769 (-),score=127.14 GILJ01009263.1:197-2287(-)
MIKGKKRGASASDCHRCFDVAFGEATAAKMSTDPLVHIGFNGGGELLLAYGESSVFVLQMPKRLKHGEIDASAKSCKGLAIGASTLSGCRVTQALWSPFSDTHVAVLTDDNIWRLFDISDGVDEPELEFAVGADEDFVILDSEGKEKPFLSGDNGSGSGGAVRAVSFAFGAGRGLKRGWEQLAVYFLMDDGSIYVRTPVLPNGCYLPVGLFRELKLSCPTSDNYRPQYRWLDSILRSVPSEPDLDPFTLVRVIQPAAWATRIPAQQGPLALEFVDSSGFVVGPGHLSITCLRTVPTAVMTANSQGEVRVLVAMEELQPLWEGEEIIDELYSPPSLLQLEAAIVPLPPHQFKFPPIHLNLDPVDHNCAYIQSVAGLTKLELPWMKRLEEISDAPDQGDLQADFDISSCLNQPGELIPLIDSMPLPTSQPAPLLGVQVVCDSLLGYMAIVVTLSGQLKTVDLIAARAKTVTATPELSFPEVNATELEPFQVEQPKRSQIPRFVSTDPAMANKTDEDLLALFMDVCKDFKSHGITYAHHVHQKIVNRARELASLSLRHEKEYKEIRTSVMQRLEMSKTIQDKIDNTRKHQEELNQRIESVLRTMSRHGALVSKAEKDFSGELREVEKQAQKHQITVRQLQHKTERALQTLAQDAKLRQRQQSYRPDQMDSLHSVIATETDLVDSLVKNIKELQLGVAEL